MKGIALFVGVALGATASAQVGDYVAVDGGYQIRMSIKPKGVWTFQTQYLNRPNKRGGGRWTKKGRLLQCVVFINGKPAKGPNAQGTLTVSPDGKTMTQRVGSRTFLFRRLR